MVVVDAEGTTKVNQVAGDCPSLTTRVFLAGGGYGGLPDEAPGEAGGWASWADGLAAAGEGPPEAEPTRSDDPMLLYFTSGTVAYPKMCCTPCLARDRPPDHRPLLAGPQAGDLHWRSATSAGPRRLGKLFAIGHGAANFSGTCAATDLT